MQDAGTSAPIYKGRCFCGAVELEITGEPFLMGYCHCSSCREWSGCPVTATSLWPAPSVKVTKGEDNIGAYSKPGKASRKWCKTCGGHLMGTLPGVTDVFPAIVSGLEFRPSGHICYGEAVLRIRDGLPKQKDMPLQAGGSGTLLPE